MLVTSVAEPIRRSLEYQAVGRKCVVVDELPQGALARYERDVVSTATIISRRGAVPDQWQEGEEVLVPTFEIAAYPTIRMSEIKARRFFIVDRAQIKAKEAIQKEEDRNIFNALIAAADNRALADASNSQVVQDIASLSTAGLNAAFRLVEQHDLVTSKLIMTARGYADVRTFGKDFYDEATTREILTTGLYGHLWTANIHVSSQMDNSTVLVLSSPDTVGVFPIRQDITVLPADDPKKLRLGWVIYEEIGICILNDYSVSKIEISQAT